MAIIDNDAFSAAQMQSKLWLVQRLEDCLLEERPIEDGYRIWLLAGWLGVTNLLLRSRNRIPVLEVRSFDLDPSCEEAADSVNRLWVWRSWEFKAHTADINLLEYRPKPDVVVNSSVEHMASNVWWDNIPNGTIVCLQASDMEDEDHINKFHNDRDLLTAYPVSELMYTGLKRFEFDDKSFYRSMIIGIK